MAFVIVKVIDITGLKIYSSLLTKTEELHLQLIAFYLCVKN